MSTIPERPAYNVTESHYGAEWRVTGAYDGVNNVRIYRNGECVRMLTVPGHRIWNYAAHLRDIAADLSRED